MKFLLIGMGGGLGAILRYLLSGVVQDGSRGTLFPIGTMVVNIAGCFAIGFLSGLVDTRAVFSPETRLFLFIGLLGGFTTFSTFGNETVNLLRGGENLLAMVNLGVSVFAGLAAVWLGRALALWIWR